MRCGSETIGFQYFFGGWCVCDLSRKISPWFLRTHLCSLCLVLRVSVLLGAPCKSFRNICIIHKSIFKCINNNIRLFLSIHTYTIAYIYNFLLVSILSFTTLVIVILIITCIHNLKTALDDRCVILYSRASSVRFLIISRGNLCIRSYLHPCIKIINHRAKKKKIPRK